MTQTTADRIAELRRTLEQSNIDRIDGYGLPYSLEAMLQQELFALEAVEEERTDEVVARLIGQPVGLPESITAILPPRKSSPNTTIEFAPSIHGTAAGTLRIKAKAGETVYHVEEFPAGVPGRGFTLRCTNRRNGQTYSVHALKNGVKTCDCKGYTGHGHCKHADAIEALLDRGAL